MLVDFVCVKILQIEDKDDDDFVYSLVTCFSLTRSTQTAVLTSLRDYLLSKCRSSSASEEDKKKFSEVRN